LDLGCRELSAHLGLAPPIGQLAIDGEDGLELATCFIDVPLMEVNDCQGVAGVGLGPLVS
jgi:hypothetical protein